MRSPVTPHGHCGHLPSRRHETRPGIQRTAACFASNAQLLVKHFAGIAPKGSLNGWPQPQAAGFRALNTVPSRPPASGRGPRFWRWTPKAVCDSEHVLRQLRPGVKVDLEPFFGTALHWRTCLCQLLQGQPLIELVLLHGCRGIGFLKNWTLPKRRNHEHSCTAGFSSSEETALKGSVTP